MRSQYGSGFTLIETLVVLAILSILAVMMLPSNEGKVNRARIQESLNLTDQYKAQIIAYYQLNGEFPGNNEEAGLPAPGQIIGNFLAGVILEDGALHLEMGNKILPRLQGQIISIRPIFVPGVEGAPVSWICGYNTVPENMIAAGENRTSVEASNLPLECR